MAERYWRLIISHLNLEVCISNDTAREECKDVNESIAYMFQRIELPFQLVVTDLCLKFEEFGRDPRRLKRFLVSEPE